MRQLTTRKTPSTRGGTQKRNHTARRKHIHAACTPPMATSINTTRVHRCRHPRKNQRHKGNVWARKARAAAQLLAAVRCLPEPSGRSRAARRCRPGPGLPLPLPGALPAPGLRAPGGAAARSAGRVPFAASKAGNALGGHVGKTKPGAPSAPQLRSPRLEKSGGARRAPARGPRAATHRRSPRPPEALRKDTRPPELGGRGSARVPPSPPPVPAAPLSTSPAARRGAARPRLCAAPARLRCRRLPPQPRPPGRRGGRCRQPPASRPPAAQPLRSRSIPAAKRPPSPRAAFCPVRGAPSLSAFVPRTGRAAAAADAQRAKSRGSSRGLSRSSQPESRPRAETRPRGRDGGDPRSRYSVRWELCSWQRFLCRLKPVQR